MNNKEYTVSEVIDSFGMNKHTWLMFMLLGLICKFIRTLRFRYRTQSDMYG